MNKLEKRLVSRGELLDSLVSSLFRGSIELDTWIISVADVLKEMTIINAQLGKGGELLDESDIKLINEYLSDVFTKGQITSRDIDLENQKVTTEKKPFGLQLLVKEINRGEVSEDELKNRIRLYGEHTRTVKENIEANRKKNNGFTEVLNILQATKTKRGTNHAKICVHATSLGWQSIEQFKKSVGLPPRHPNCVCQVVYR